MIKIDPAKIKYLIIHHTATSRDRTTFEAVKKYHIGLGWGDIGYHWLINGKGDLIEGRGDQWVGAHCNKPKADSVNFRSIGIALTGNFETESPSKEQIATLETLVANLRAKYGIPRENILGHGEVEEASTLCPGKNFLPYLKTYRARPEETDNKKKTLLDLVDSVEQKVEELKNEIQKLP